MSRLWPDRWRRSAPPPDRGELLREVRRLELRARRLMDSPALGSYESVFRGHGIEFSEVREYQPGDPFQSIDWKVSARMRRPFVKRFVEERELTVLLMVDLSGSTDFGTRGRLKRRLAIELAGVLGLAALRSQDRVGLLMFTDRLEKYVRPLRGRNRTLCLLYDMLAFEPEGKGTDISAAFTAATNLLPVRSLVFVISDFESPEPFWDALMGLTRRHDVVAMEITDPIELELPDVGLLEVRDPEGGATQVLDLASAPVRADIQRRADQQRERRAAAFRRARADRVVVRTDRPYAADLAAFFAARARRRRW
ncbi:MAG: DUF58 domain-containing protein [Gemmatimonadota bacterium]